MLNEVYDFNILFLLWLKASMWRGESMYSYITVSNSNRTVSYFNRAVIYSR